MPEKWKTNGPEESILRFKMAPRVILENITCIFNICIGEHTIPEEWKTAYITPIHTKGDKLNARIIGDYLIQ